MKSTQHEKILYLPQIRNHTVTRAIYVDSLVFDCSYRGIFPGKFFSRMRIMLVQVLRCSVGHPSDAVVHTSGPGLITTDLMNTFIFRYSFYIVYWRSTIMVIMQYNRAALKSGRVSIRSGWTMSIPIKLPYRKVRRPAYSVY